MTVKTRKYKRFRANYTIMSADIETLKETLESEYGVEATVNDEDTIMLHDVTEDVNVGDMAKLTSTRGFNVYAVGEEGETLTFPNDFRVER
jgi:hypothetical protein